MKKKNKILRLFLIDYVRFYYMGYLNDSEKKHAIEVFELLSEEGIDVRDFVPIIRQMQYDLDQMRVKNV